MNRGRRLGAIAVVGLGLLLTAGCTTQPAGPPDPFPPRPAPIDITRIDPCRTLTPEQVARRGLGAEDERAESPRVGDMPTRACGWWNLHSDFGYSVQLMPQDAADAVGAPGTAIGSVSGYGTVRITDRETTAPLCEILVDVDDGRLMRIQVRATALQADHKPMPIDRTCAEAQALATDVVGTARTLAP